MNERVQYFTSIGMSASQVAKVVSSNPNLLGLKVQTNLAPTYQFLESVSATPNVLADIVAMPQILTYSLDKRIKPRYVKLNQVKDHFIVFLVLFLL